MATLSLPGSVRCAVGSEQVKALWAEIEADLTHIKDEIHSEIHNYPPPIPACDAQFNFLLEERAKIWQELGRLTTLSKSSLTAPDPLVLVEEFIHSSAYLRAEVKQKVRSSLPLSTMAAA